MKQKLNLYCYELRNDMTVEDFEKINFLIREINNKVEKANEIIKILTPKETETLRKVCEGLSNPEIAGILFVSTNTVKAHVKNCFGKILRTGNSRSFSS